MNVFLLFFFFKEKKKKAAKPPRLENVAAAGKCYGRDPYNSKRIPVFFGKVLEKLIHLLDVFGTAVFVSLVTIEVNRDSVARTARMREVMEI